MADLSNFDLNQPLVNPATGSVVDKESNDSLIEAYKEAKEIIKDLQRFQNSVSTILESRLERGNTKTNRIRGRCFEAVFVDQDVKPSTTALRQIISAYPEIAPQYIVPASYRIDKTQYKKLTGTASDDPQFQAVKMLIDEAINSGYQPAPRITKIETV